MLRSFFVLNLLCFFIQAFPQKNFLAGYVVTASGDTINGSIDYQNWATSPKKIAFRGKEDRVVEYSPIQIKAFTVADENYVGAIIESENVVTVDQYNPDILRKSDTVFLQTIISGPKSLYSYVPAMGRELFYIGSDSVPTLLVYKEYFKSKNGLDVQVENKKFIGQLTVYLADCPTSQPVLSHQGYNKKKLEKLFVDYYKQCRTTQIKFHKKTEPITAHVEFFLGGSLTSIKFSGGDGGFDYLTQANFSQSRNFSFGLAVDLIMPRNNKRWSWRNELQSTSFSCTGNSTYFIPGDPVLSQSTNSIGLTQFKINSLVRYRFRSNRTVPFLNFGISNGFTTGYTNNSNAYSSVRLENPRAFQQGLLAGGGISVKNLSFECRYEGDYFGISDSNVKSTITRFYLLISVLFPNKKSGN